MEYVSRSGCGLMSMMASCVSGRRTIYRAHRGEALESIGGNFSVIPGSPILNLQPADQPLRLGFKRAAAFRLSGVVHPCRVRRDELAAGQPRAHFLDNGSV